MNDLNWIGPRLCESNACGEVAKLSAGRVGIRSSRHQFNIAILDGDEWHAFLAAVKAGDFDEVTS